MIEQALANERCFNTDYILHAVYHVCVGGGRALCLLTGYNFTTFSYSENPTVKCLDRRESKFLNFTMITEEEDKLDLM